MFVVYRQPLAGARLPMGHFKGETAALEYAQAVKNAHPAEVVTVAEEADGKRDVFCDVKPAVPVASGESPAPVVEIERLAEKGGKK